MSNVLSIIKDADGNRTILDPTLIKKCICVDKKNEIIMMTCIVEQHENVIGYYKSMCDCSNQIELFKKMAVANKSSHHPPRL